MVADTTTSVLNRLLVVHHRSLAQYLSFASPTWHLGDELARATLRAMAADQQSIVERAGELILEQGGVVDYGSFPMTYTGYHDLSFEFLLTKLLENQTRNIGLIEQCLVRVSRQPLAKALVEEALGAAKGHLESLQELQKQQSVTSIK